MQQSHHFLKATVLFVMSEIRTNIFIINDLSFKRLIYGSLGAIAMFYLHYQKHKIQQGKVLFRLF